MHNFTLDGDLPDPNIALFADASDETFVRDALAPWHATGSVYLMTSDDALLPMFAPEKRVPFAGSLPDQPQASSVDVLSDLESITAQLSNISCLVVDMTWALNEVWAPSLLERWGGNAQGFCERTGIAVVSLYDRELTIEALLAAGLRAHRWIAAPSGVHDNPHWLPRDVIATGTQQDQLGFLLGRIVPEFAEARFHSTDKPNYARGATPDWAQPSPSHLASLPSHDRWHIHCLGPLKVYLGGNIEADWAIPGSSPKKSRALFAYLLNRGESGAHTDQLGEFLWPDGTSEDVKRGRLRHTLAMLRKTLGGSHTVQRMGEHYRLNIPEGSWIDIPAFEQLCRRGLSLFDHEDYAGAARVYEGADQLYRGDLFADLARGYTESEFDDWCMPKRTWLRDMALKLKYDMSTVLRKQGRHREALSFAMRGLQMDPTNEPSNIEVLLALSEQGRNAAVARHYQQYLKAVVLDGEGEPSDAVRDTYRALMAKADAQGTSAPGHVKA